MSKPTLQDKLAAIENVQLQIKIFFEEIAPYEKDNVLAEMNRIYLQLERRKQRLLNSPVANRKPKAVATVSPVDLPTGDYRNTKERRGRHG